MTAAEIVDLDDSDAAWQLLAAYEAVDHDYAAWATAIGLTPDTVAADRAYSLIHMGYAQLWMQMGDMFHVKLWPLADEWRVRLRREARGGLANRLTRAFARAS